MNLRPLFCAVLNLIFSKLLSQMFSLHGFVKQVDSQNHIQVFLVIGSLTANKNRNMSLYPSSKQLQMPIQMSVV